MLMPSSQGETRREQAIDDWKVRAHDGPDADAKPLCKLDQFGQSSRTQQESALSYRDERIVAHGVRRLDRFDSSETFLAQCIGTIDPARNHCLSDRWNLLLSVGL